MPPVFLRATQDRALRLFIILAVNRRFASSNLARSGSRRSTPPCQLGDCAWITAYSEVIRLDDKRGYRTSEISPQHVGSPFLGNCAFAVHSAYRGVRFTDRQSVGRRYESFALHQLFQRVSSFRSVQPQELCPILCHVQLKIHSAD